LTRQSLLPPPTSSRTAYETAREKAQAEFEEQATFEAWSLNPCPLSTAKDRTVLAILIQHGLMSKMVEIGSLVQLDEGGS
jgi:hypothetical protein